MWCTDNCNVILYCQSLQEPFKNKLKRMQDKYSDSLQSAAESKGGGLEFNDINTEWTQLTNDLNDVSRQHQDVYDVTDAPTLPVSLVIVGLQITMFGKVC